MTLDAKYVKRQFCIMLDIIEKYRSGDIKLSKLINDLEGLCYLVEDFDSKLTIDIQTQINKLELTNAIKIDKEGINYKLTEEEQNSIDTITAEIEKTIKVRILSL